MKLGCFGSVVTYSPDNEHCPSCGDRLECAQKVVGMLESISVAMDVSDLMRVIRRDSGITAQEGDKVTLTLVGSMTRRTPVQKRFDLTEDQEEAVKLIAGRYSKAERLVRSIFKHDIDLRGSLLQGVNPFDGVSSHAYMKPVCDLLLTGGFYRGQLRKVLSEEFDWSDQTVNSHVLVITHTLIGLSVASELPGGFFVLRLL